MIQPLCQLVFIFPREQLLLLLYEDLVANPLDTMKQVHEFLAIDTGFTPDTASQHNTALLTHNRLLDLALMQDNPIRFALRRILPPGLRPKVRNWLIRFNSKEVPNELTPELYNRLLNIYQDDISNLQQLWGQDLSMWLEPAKSVSESSRW
jgi:hypothetical protein